MKIKKSIKLNLLPYEKGRLRSAKIKATDLEDYSAKQLSTLLDLPLVRAREIRAMAEFQSVPSVGIRFAEDLISMGYYTLSQLRKKNGARLVEEFEQLKGYWIDPCVEDQFRLVVYYARTKDGSRNWWDFTDERKTYRSEHGYPQNRPKKAWHEADGLKKSS